MASRRVGGLKLNYAGVGVEPCYQNSTEQPICVADLSQMRHTAATRF